MNLQIDRLALRLTGVSERDARRLAQLVVRSLARSPGHGAASTRSLRLDLSAPDGEPLESLADRIASRVASALGNAP